MNCKTILALCCAALLCVLSGCQLARIDAGQDADARGDRLIGVYMTRESLDLFDFERYFEDNLTSGGLIATEDAQAYQGRLYATLTNEEFVFEGLAGFSHFVAVMPSKAEQGDSYFATSSDPAISDGATHIRVGGENSGIELSGTVYVLPSASAVHAFYFNPVYQSADGRVYLTSGSGLSATMDTEGSLMTQTLEDTYTETENGETTTEHTKIQISVGMMFPPEEIVVLQMDADNNLITRTAYEPGALPTAINPTQRTDYLIVETHKRDETDTPSVTRALYGREDETLDSFAPRADGVCTKQTTTIEWI